MFVVVAGVVAVAVAGVVVVADIFLLLLMFFTKFQIFNSKLLKSVYKIIEIYFNIYFMMET